MAAIPLPAAPAILVAEPSVKLTGVYFDDRKRTGCWRVILVRGDGVKHIKIPNSDEYMSRERAEELAKQVTWSQG